MRTQSINRRERKERKEKVLLGVLGVLCGSILVGAQAAPALQFRGANESKHATIAASPAGITAAPGEKVALFVDVTPKPNIHVYAPGTKDYIPITVKTDAQPHLKFGKVTYPKSEIM